MLSARTAGAPLLLAVVLAGVTITALPASADGIDPGCVGSSAVFVRVCADDPASSPGPASTPGSGVSSAKQRGGKPDKPVCRYTKMDPPPPAGSPLWGGHSPADKGGMFVAECDDTQTSRPVWIADGAAPAGQAIDPEAVARQAVDKVRLDGPKIASPRPGGTYVIGMPTWMWATPSESTFGPTTATATAGGVTVTATATVTSVAWAMGDGAVVVCPGPGTPYTKDRGKQMSPDCGHRYTKLARPLGQPYKGTATSTWTVDWQVVGGTGETGTFTETRATAWTALVQEIQTVGVPPGT
ncbi:ATP/GTP-binding protein [Streptomyces sp. NBC_00237]|uniref:ATP/GTP-binding protein n=1 Tax=Streptomyces sp. NBC_00237 TaxID=2975687 RepID=UPI00225B9A14|nr:ATP/GTP-binding protein [Streptomyces sp. NBC_00237]MCX5202668.1 ATP/GTP-binding protein [Streptomyces sp. NBC_00237]